MTTPRTCGWCNRRTNDHIVREIDTDRGPDHVIWCRNVDDCRAARAAGVRQRWALRIPPYDLGMPADAPATRSSFDMPTLPISTPHPLERLPQRVWSDEEWERIQHGCISQEMEDRWDVFAEGDVLFIHRSWTGYGVFEATFAPVDGGGWRIAGAVVERDPERYGGSDDERDGVLMEMVISGNVLHKPSPGLYEKWVELSGRTPGERVPQTDAGPRGNP